MERRLAAILEAEVPAPGRLITTQAPVLLLSNVVNAARGRLT